ncbi:MAG: PKD domain-containing protein [Roseivirga sp.]|nr:PKD domain-containing protein [Roseivirga sp.]
MRNFLAIFCLLLSVSTSSFSQSTTEGTDFWFGFMENNEPTLIELQVYVSAKENAKVNLTDISGSLNEGVNIPANSAVVIQVPTSFMSEIEGKSNTGLHLTSDVNVSVYLLNQRQFSADAAVILPTSTLGKEYWVMAHKEPEGDEQPNSQESEMLIVATADNTSLEITPSVTTYGDWAANVTQSIVLNAGETYQIKSDEDLTGTYVKVVGEGASCAPIAVFGGNKFTNVGGCGGNRDHLVEQMIPRYAWGRDFLYIPYETRQGGDYVKIMAAENGTTVSISQETDPILLNAGEWQTIKALPGVREISADKPIQVGQFSRSTMCDNVDSDPFMIMLSPLQQRIKQATFDVFNLYQITEFYLTLITTKEGFSNVKLDGNDISSEFVVYENSAYASLSIAKGTHNLQASDGVVAYVYGYGASESFGYSAGLNLEDLSLTIASGDNDIGLLDLEACVNSAVALEVLPANPDNPIVFSKYAWDLGDGTVLEGEQIQHVYTQTGKYTVTLTAEGDTDICGADRVVTLTREITIVEPEPVNIIGATSVCPGATGLEYRVEGTPDDSYEWTVVGGTVILSGGNSITIDWGASRDDASVSVKVNSASVCGGESELPVVINKSLDPALPMGPAEVCFSNFATVDYYVQPTSGSEYSWFVEGGSFVGSNTNDWVTVAWDGPDTPGRVWYREFNPSISDCEGISEVLEVTIYPDLEVVTTESHVLCFGEANGSASFEVSGGKPGNYRVRFGADEISGTELMNLDPGNYTVTIIDALECTKEVNFTIDSPTALNLELETTDVLCFNGASGTATATVNGGTAPYTYKVNNGGFQSSPEFAGLNVGQYTLTAQDANGCTVERSFSINEPQMLLATLNFVDGNTIRVDATGGTPGYEYSADGMNFQESTDFNIQSSGEYTITVRDANACTLTISSSFIVTSVDLPGHLPTVSTYPNPVTDVLIISQVDAGDVITLVDMRGGMLNEVKVKTSEKDYKLPIVRITESIFLLRIKDRQGRVKLTQKVIRTER